MLLPTALDLGLGIEQTGDGDHSMPLLSAASKECLLPSGPWLLIPGSVWSPSASACYLRPTDEGGPHTLTHTPRRGAPSRL